VCELKRLLESIEKDLEDLRFLHKQRNEIDTEIIRITKKLDDKRDILNIKCGGNK